MSTPIFLISYNRLTWLYRMAEQCEAYPDVEIHIVDNDSDYQPLLEWLGRCGYQVHLPGKNYGKGVVWKTGIDQIAKTNYIVSDPDLDMSGIPLDLLDVLSEGLARYPWARSAGVSLAIDDLPECKQSKEVVKWESKYWRTKADGKDGRYWTAPIDTTFAMYRPGTAPTYGNGKSIRVDKPYTAKHLPWYLTPKTATEEDRHYYNTGTTWGKKAWGPHIKRELGKT